MNHGHEGKKTTLVLITNKVDITLHTPILTPAVLDDPVGSALLVLTPASKKNSMIVLLDAVAREDTALVVEQFLSMDQDSDRTIVLDIGTKIILMVDLNLRPVMEALHSSAGLVLARLLLANISVLLEGVDTSLDDMLEGHGRKTTVAGIITELLAAESDAVMIAIDKHLRAEIHKLVLLDGQLTLHAAAGAESPAGTAVALILHTGNGTPAGPIEGSRNGRNVGGGNVFLNLKTELLRSGHGNSVGADKLLHSLISESINTVLLRSTLSVELGDLLLVLEVNLHTVLTLLLRIVGLAILHGPHIELFLKAGSISSTDKCQKDKLHSVHIDVFNLFPLFAKRKKI